VEKNGSQPRPCIYALNKDELPTLSGFYPFVPKYKLLLNKLPAV